MTNANIVAIDDLRRAIDRLLTDTAAALGDTIDLKLGYYWQVPAKQCHAVDPRSIDLTVGDISDDIQTMHDYLASPDPTPSPWHELNHLTGILRALEAQALP